VPHYLVKFVLTRYLTRW